MSAKQSFFILCVLFSMHIFAESNYKVQNNALVMPASIQFDKHAYDVKNENDPMIDFVAKYLNENEDITKLRIEGHVYTEKSSEENMKLSLQRAAMVSYYLTTKGVDCSRLLPVAYGDTQPVAPTDECNLDNNTRIVFFNAELNHVPVANYSVNDFNMKVFNPCE